MSGARYFYDRDLPKNAKWVTEEAYEYHDEADRWLATKRREVAQYKDGTPVIDERTGKQAKRFPILWRGTPDGREPSGARKLLYRLPELLKEVSANPTGTVYVVEGERKVNALRKWGLTATCAPYGTEVWEPEHSELLRIARGGTVVIAPDNDGPGRRFADKVGRGLAGVVLKRELLELPGLPEHGDIVDWVRLGGTKEQLLTLATREWKPFGPEEPEGLEIESIEIRPGIVDVYNIKVRGCGTVAVGAEQLSDFRWFNRACIAHLQRAFDPPRSTGLWARKVDAALRGAKRLEPPGEALHIHGTESWGDEDVEWTVHERIPREGVGLLAGPYGIFKTFVLLDVFASLITGLPFLGRQVRRRCGVLLFAPEGGNTIRLRLRALIEHKLKSADLSLRDLLDQHGVDFDNLPFAFVGDCRPLLDPRTVDWIVEQARRAHDHFRATHGMDLGAIGYDTLAAAAGWDNENDAAQAQIVMNHMADVGLATDTFGLAVDHFGQDISSGARGSTAKESAASTIFYLRGKSDENGVFTDTRLILRKQRAGPQGMVFPFAAPEVQMGTDKHGLPVTSRIIDWNAKPPEPEKPSVQVIFEKVLIGALAKHGETVRINGGAEIQAVRKDKVRAAFKEAYAADHPDANTKAKNLALRRALGLTGRAHAVAGGVVGGVAYLWRPVMPF